MAKQLFIDVLIVGAGPAGSASALSILKHSKLSVAIVESSSFDNLKVGEQVSSSIFDILSYIGIQKQDFDKDCFLDGYGSLASWGNPNMIARHSVMSLNGQSFQLDREKFDLHLVQKAANEGAMIFPRARVKQIAQQPDASWNISVKHETQGELIIQSKYLIDATGRQSGICRMLDIKSQKSDELAAIGTFATFDSDKSLPQEVYLETVAKGWWYCTALPNSRVNVTFFTDASIIKQLQLHKKENWTQLLSQTNHIKNLLAGAVAHEDLWIRNAFSQMILPYKKVNFIAVGDAAVSFDPISSMGIGFALVSGCSGAKAIIDLHNNHSSAIDLYWQDIKQVYDQYNGIKNQFYAKETRFNDAPFWNARKIQSTAFADNLV